MSNSQIIFLEFNYTFKWVDDGAYGYHNKETGEWNGLMGELLSQVGTNISFWCFYEYFYL